jgi:hypothetical protein
VRFPDGQSRVLSGADLQPHQGTRFDASVVLPMDGRFRLVVTNPDGGVSEPFPVIVRKAEPRPQAPVIARVTPEDLESRPEPQVLRVEGQRFMAGLTVLLTDPIGTPVADVTVADVTPMSFVLTARLEVRGDYELVATNPSGG